MLIEDFDVTIEGLQVSDAKVVSINYTFQINSLSSAQIVIERPQDNSVLHLEIQEYTREQVVGSEIEIKWKANDNKLIYKGMITGLTLAKSAGNVQYTLTAAGGPTALFNTTLSAPGWYPFGTYDNGAIANLFRDEILNADWETPLELLKTLVEKIPTSSSFDPNLNSDSSKNIFPQVIADLTGDLNNFHEAPILSNFFGYIGNFQDYDAAIRRRIQDMVSFEYSDLTFWNFLIALCSEIGATVIPWISKTFIIPNMLFTNPPKLNVLFPSLIRNTGLVSEPIDHPDQVVMYSQTGIAHDISVAYRELRENTSVVFPKEFRDNFSPYAGRRYLVIPPSEYRYLEYIFYEQLRKTQEEQKSKKVDESKEDRDENAGKLNKDLQELYKKYCENFAEYYYRKIRAEKDFGQVTAVFQPFLAPGYGSFIIDAKEGMNFRGVITSVSHNISPTSASTIISLSFLISMDEEISFKNPLWSELVPSGSESASILENEPAVSFEATEHIPFSTGLVDPEITRENEDEELAAKYTGRIAE